MELINDFNTSVKKALSDVDPNWEKYNGLVVCGTHNPKDTEDVIDKIRIARETGIPMLGICFGHQLAAIEYARNVLEIKDATSEEFGKGTFIVKKLPNLKVGLHSGESYWNNYEVDEETMKQWNKPKHFITCQFHPEYQSSKEKPHELLVKFIELCKINAVGRQP